MAPPKYPPLAPENIRAVVTTKWTNGYRPVALTNIESYRVDSQLDQDSDTFEITFGDPTNQMRATLNRDNEIRIQLFGLGQNISYLHTGIVDELEYDEENRLVMTGRDLSSVATDTDAEAAVFRHKKIDDVIKQRAFEIGMKPKFALTPTRVRPKLLTDGSETEWEFWYRMVRGQSQWLWFTPDGYLTSGPLNYIGSPTYYFGTPNLKDTGNARKRWIPVERIGYRKSTQGRVERWIIWYKDKKGLSQKVEQHDPTVSDWVRKPLKYKEDAKIHSASGATQNLLEEIFETKVGALEIRITIPDVGIMVRQNTIAHLRIPELDIDHDWFVVGSTILADGEGFTQQVRLREKGYAISKRIPTEPTPADPGKPPGTEECPSLRELTTQPDWIDCFIQSARNNSGDIAAGWVFFCAVLLGICEHETHFHNERSHESGAIGGNCKSRVWGPGSHIDYYPYESGGVLSGSLTLHEWNLSFANVCGDGFVEGEYAVGPMQLFTPSLKKAADQLLGPINEFTGGRWDPCSNIEIAARKLDTCARQTGVAGYQDPDKFWPAVDCYGGQSGFGLDVRNGTKTTIGVMAKDVGWYDKLKAALAKCADTSILPPVGIGDINPFYGVKGLIAGRVDQGKDYAGGGNGNILAVNNATVMGVKQNWYKTQPYVWYRIDTGPNAGKYIYVSEGIDVIVTSGKVSQGEPVASFNQDPVNPTIEIGWAVEDGRTLSVANGTQDTNPNHSNTPEGLNFEAYLRKLGAPV